MSDLFETDELRAYWDARPVRSYVVTLGFYPRGCWVTGNKTTKPKLQETFYVRARDGERATLAAKRQASMSSRWPSNAASSDKVLCDGIRYMGPLDFPPYPEPWSIQGPADREGASHE